MPDAPPLPLHSDGSSSHGCKTVPIGVEVEEGHSYARRTERSAPAGA